MTTSSAFLDLAALNGSIGPGITVVNHGIRADLSRWSVCSINANNVSTTAPSGTYAWPAFSLDGGTTWLKMNEDAKVRLDQVGGRSSGWFAIDERAKDPCGVVVGMLVDPAGASGSTDFETSLWVAEGDF